MRQDFITVEEFSDMVATEFLAQGYTSIKSGFKDRKKRLWVRTTIFPKVKTVFVVELPDEPERVFDNLSDAVKEFNNL